MVINTYLYLIRREFCVDIYPLPVHKSRLHVFPVPHPNSPPRIHSAYESRLPVFPVPHPNSPPRIRSAYESRTSSGSLFFQRQFWVAWKLLSQVLMWHKVISEHTLAELGIKGILNLYLIPALNIAVDVSPADGLQKAKYVRYLGT